MAHPLDPITLRLFLAVAERRSMARAAEHEHITTAAISRRILDLEARVGVQLLDRSSAGVRPTAAGLALVEEATHVLAALDAAQRRVAAFAETARGDLRIGVNPTSVLGSLPRDLTRFAARYPLVRITLAERSSDEVARLIASAELDLGVLIAGAPRDGLDYAAYRSTPLLVIAPVDHPLALHAAVRFAQVAPYDLVMQPAASRMGRLLVDAAAAEGVALRVGVQAASQEGIRRLVQAGMGVAILPEPSARPYAQLHEYVCIELLESWARIDTVACVRSSERVPAPARLLFSLLSRS